MYIFSDPIPKLESNNKLQRQRYSDICQQTTKNEGKKPWLNRTLKKPNIPESLIIKRRITTAAAAAAARNAKKI